MSKFNVKVYIVQKADRDGTLGDIVAAKLTYDAAHKIALKNAPAKVHCVIADKSTYANAPGYDEYQRACNQLQFGLSKLG